MPWEVGVIKLAADGRQFSPMSIAPKNSTEPVEVSALNTHFNIKGKHLAFVCQILKSQSNFLNPGPLRL
jgi:hypothetical protein